MNKKDKEKVIEEYRHEQAKELALKQMQIRKILIGLTRAEAVSALESIKFLLLSKSYNE